MINFKKIEQSLLEFWSHQLQYTIDNHNLHITYPLLLPNGWQLSFSIYYDETNNVYELSDNRKTFAYLEQYFPKLSSVNSRIVKEKCKFFGLQISESGCIYKALLEEVLPLELQLFAEGIVALHYIIYRFERHSSYDSLPYETVRNVFIASKIPIKDNVYLQGRHHTKIRADFVSPNAVIRVINNRNPFDTLQITCFQFMDYKLDHIATQRALIYNPDHNWNSDCQALADSREYFEFSSPYTDVEKLEWFAKEQLHSNK